MPDVHAKLSASGAHRWSNCPGSVALEKDIADKGSTYAAEGTVAHALAELIINYNLGRLNKSEFSKKKKEIEKSEYFCKEMEDYITEYTQQVWEFMNYAKSQSKDAELLTEQRLDFSDWVPDGFGTGDVVIVYDGVIHIIDLKYGKGVGVSAENNPQLMLYGLGALSTYDMLYDIKEIQLTIIQPRLDIISSQTLYTDELLKWGEYVIKPAAEEALKDDAPCHAGDWCKFCKAKAICKARADYMLELTKMEFADPRVLTDEQIVEVLAKADQLKNWAEDVSDYALTEAVDNGKKWPGYKVVEGRSNRKYSDDGEVIKALTDAGYEEAIIFEKKLLTITNMEKAIGKKQFQELLGDLIVKPAGKPTLVPQSDKRPEISSAASAKEDFKDEV